ncbi:MAG: ABC transporter ATP-binding protein/permease [Clostridia bacterium]|nr:ABC transporter ATP-binding protein/permease [Clostridia bacterium]
MLQIKEISKQYKTGDLVQVALNKVSLNFRDNEFVSILGPSGSGKTTLLNIIGGLDRYDKGDLIINNVSTKKYKDRDWDSYRNHTVGFVFQSYNLISHQTVLANVELALTISGISKKARKRRALAALDKVGLKEQAHKKPNQMSGGQMQRVAIARALVNDPDILLADEPTGALDTNTSVQVMELLKEVAKDRLVIMVTHNPELAEQYSTRIVNLRDGEIQGDTNPFNPDVSKVEPPKHKNLGKSSMSMPTAFSLSLNNLLTKKGRTFLTSFAGSIGIIGIAMILSLSTGFQNYVDKIQEDTLTSYPLTVQSETADMTAMLMGAADDDEEEKEAKQNVVKEQQNVAEMFGAVGRNDLKSFKKYLDDNKKDVDEMVSLTRYSYAVSPTIYTRNAEKELVLLNPSDFIAALMGSSSSLMSGGITIFSELVDNQEMIDEQYEIIEGKFPKEYNEIMLVLPDEHTISDMLLYGVAIRDQDELEDMIGKIIEGEKVENKNEPLEMTYEELMNIELKLVNPADTYKYNTKYDIYEDMTDDEKFMDNVYDNALDLKVVGIAKPKGDGGLGGSGVLYTRNLTKYVIDTASKSEIVQKQLVNKDINVFSGKDFDDEEKSAGLDFEDMISIDEKMLEEAFAININEKDIENMTKGYMTEISEAINADTQAAHKTFLDNLSKITKNILNDYIEKNQVGGIAFIKLNDVPKVVSDGLSSDKNKAILADMEAKYVVPQDAFVKIYNPIITAFLQQYVSMMGSVSGGTGGLMPPIGDVTVPPTGNVVDGNTVVGNTTVDNTITDNTIIDNTTVDNTIVDNTNTVTNTTIPGGTQSGTTTPAVGGGTSSTDVMAPLVSTGVDTMVNAFVGQDMIVTSTEEIAVAMTEAIMQKTILTKVGELIGKLMETMGNAFNVDPDKMASAFKFDMSEEEMKRLFKSMTSTTVENADTNLLALGYQDMEAPTTISFYFKDFSSKEKFIDFIDDYNDKMEKEDEEKVIKYSDITGLLMSSVKTIVDSVSYVLIAFVSISLVVSSIMIGIITYISVLERTKEIGVLRAIGASKKNISSIFNAETFIVGLFSGLIGIGTTLLLLIPTNMIIHSVNEDITALLPFEGGAILVILSVILTLIGGIIPSRAAAKKDPVLALRSE